VHPSPDQTTLEYSSLRGPVRFSREETPDGVTFTTAPPSAVVAMALAAFPIVLLVLAEAFLLGQAYRLYLEQPTLKYVFRPLVGAIAVLVFLALAVTLGLRAWRRRKVPICIAIMGPNLVLITPHQVEMRREIPLTDVQQVLAIPTGISLRLEKVADLHVVLRSSSKPINVLHGFPRHDVEFIAAELTQRLNKGA
jgi:hypothetical protein